MSWLSRWFQRRVVAALNEPVEDDSLKINLAKVRSRGTVTPSPFTASRTRSIDSNEGISFTLYRADNGWVVETRHYNHKTDMNDTDLYLITEDQDMGERIGHILTLQALKR